MSRKEKAILTRTKLVNIVDFLIKNNEFHDIHIKDICSRAEVSISNFYHHFPNKQTIFIELLSTYEKNIYTNLKDKDSLEELFYQYAVLIDQLGYKNVLEIFIYSITTKDYILKNSTNLWIDISKILNNMSFSYQFLDGETVDSLSKKFIVFFRGLLYEWCISSGSYSFIEVINKDMNHYIKSFIIGLK